MIEKNNILIARNISLDLAHEQLLVDGEPVALRRKPLLLLHALMSHPHELVTKRTLIEVGWGTVPVTDAVLTTAIKEVRRALGDDARSPFAVENVHGRGYRFLLDVVETPSEGLPDGGELTAPGPDTGTTAGDETTGPPSPTASAPTPASAATAAPTASPRGRRRAAAGAVGLIVLLAVVLVAVRQWPGGGAGIPEPVLRDPAGSAVARHTKPSVAVLPLDDMSPAGDRGWFADGLTEEILNELAQSPDLLVASRTSSFRFRGQRVDIREIGRELGVEFVMEGSVRTVADRLRVTVQLIRTDDGLHVLSESWDRPFQLQSVLAVQQEISRKVLETLDAALAPEAWPRTAAAVDIDLNAYEDFLRGREQVRSRTAAGLREGIALLQESADAAPDFAPTHAMLALGWLLAASNLGEPLETARTRAAGHLRIAMALAPQAPEVLIAASLQAMADRNLPRALELADAAVERAPSSFEAHYRRGVALTMLGRRQEAEEAYRRAALLDPLSPLANGSLVLGHLASRRPAEALELARRIVRWNPEHAASLFYLGEVQRATGAYTEGFRSVAAALKRTPNQSLAIRRRAELLWRIGADVALAAGNDPREWAARAAVLVARGDVDAALAMARENREEASNGLDALDIAYWCREPALAAELAAQQVEAERLTSADGSAFTYRREIHQAIVVLAEGPMTESLRQLMSALFKDWRPSSDAPAMEQDFLGAAAWRMLEDDPAGALDWLERAAARGLVLRELQLDPLFDQLRESERFQAVLLTMEETAARHRANVNRALEMAMAR
jgi:TolB-like protein/DNA-binding winged helix-turn-helix (wHTH) protein